MVGIQLSKKTRPLDCQIYGQIDEEFTGPLTQEGINGYKSLPHHGPGMVSGIQIGGEVQIWTGGDLQASERCRSTDDAPKQGGITVAEVAE